MKLRPTAVVWMRGMLQHEYGVAPTEIHWRPSSARCAMASSTRFSRRGRRPRSCAASRISDAGLFPIMHLIGIRRELAEQHPWLAMNVYKALAKSKALAFEELKLVDTMRVAHPWLADEIGRVQALMGEDYWRYGVKENSREIGALMKYAAADGLISREIGAEELFDPTTAEELRF